MKKKAKKRMVKPKSYIVGFNYNVNAWRVSGPKVSCHFGSISDARWEALKLNAVFNAGADSVRRKARP